MHNIRNLVTLFLVLSILDIIRSGQHVLLHSLHGFQLVLVKLGHTELSRHTLGTRVVTQTLTMAMSCLAAGLTTVVTSFSALESAAWISVRSWELGLESDMLHTHTHV